MNMPVSMPAWLILNIYSAVLLAFIAFYTLRSANRHAKQQKTFFRVLTFMFLLLAADSLSRISRVSPDLYGVAFAATAALFLSEPYELLLCLKYAGSLMAVDNRRIRECMIPQFFLAAADNVLVTVSLFNGAVFYFDEARVYRRGPLFPVCVAILMMIVVLYEVFILANRKHIERKSAPTLIFFPFPPVITGILQVTFQNLPFAFSGMTLSLLILFIYTQSRNMDIDYLTGAYNRRKLDFYLQEKIRAATAERTFSAIMLDLDHFKEINDTCGHGAGDVALEGAANLLKKCFRSEDFVARYGGDEFCVVLNISERKNLEAAVAHLKKKLQEYNAQHRRSFSLGFSIGYSVYDVRSGMDVKQFQEEIDRLMYEDKIIKHREARQPTPSANPYGG